SVGREITAYQEIAGGLTRRVGAAGYYGVRFFGSALRHIAVHFIGADLEKPANLGRSGGFQEDRGAYHIGPDEPSGIENRSVHVRLSRKIGNRVDVVLLDEAFHGRSVANIAMHKPVAWIWCHIAQVLKISGVAKSIQVHDTLYTIPGQQKSQKMRADKSCP